MVVSFGLKIYIFCLDFDSFVFDVSVIYIVVFYEDVDVLDWFVVFVLVVIYEFENVLGLMVV